MHRTPRHLPQLWQMMEKIPGNEKEIAKYLGLSLTTLRKYCRQEKAPRPVMVALFWITSWGEQTIDADLFNQAMYARTEAGNLKKEVKALKEQIRLLEMERIHYAKAANAPSFGERREIFNKPGNAPAMGHGTRQRPSSARGR